MQTCTEQVPSSGNVDAEMPQRPEAVTHCLTGQVPAKEDLAERSIWALRSREEAERFWDSEFGHLRREGGAAAQEAATGQARQQHEQSGAGQQGFVASWHVQQQPSPAFAAAAVGRAQPAPSPEQAQLRPTTGPGRAPLTNLRHPKEPSAEASG